MVNVKVNPMNSKMRPESLTKKYNGMRKASFNFTLMFNISLINFLRDTNERINAREDNIRLR